VPRIADLPLQNMSLGSGLDVLWLNGVLNALILPLQAFQDKVRKRDITYDPANQAINALYCIRAPGGEYIIVLTRT
jgi:hypothetical protein